MSLPACFEDLNAAWFTSIIGQINAAQTPGELQTLVNQVYATIALLNSTIENQLTYLGPIEALLTAPAGNFTAIIGWINDMITFLTQMYAPYAKMTAQLASIVTEVAALTAAVEAVAAAKFPTATITIPSVAPFCQI